jgi:hypothetical protein
LNSKVLDIRVEGLKGLGFLRVQQFWVGLGDPEEIAKKTLNQHHTSLSCEQALPVTHKCKLPNSQKTKINLKAFVVTSFV